MRTRTTMLLCAAIAIAGVTTPGFARGEDDERSPRNSRSPTDTRSDARRSGDEPDRTTETRRTTDTRRSSAGESRPAGRAWVMERARGGGEIEQQIARRADSAQAGVVVEIAEDHIVIDPYESWAGDARIPIGDTTQVFRNRDRVNEKAHETIRRGEEVNVYFADRPLRALGIRVLGRDEASQLRTAISQRSGPSGRSADRGSSPSGTGSVSGDKDRTASGGISGGKDRSSGGGIFDDKDDRSAEPGQGWFGAAASQAGRITLLTGKTMVLAPYERGVDQERLDLPKDVQVRRGGERLGREALRRGDDVRVFYEEGRGDRRRVVGIEVLPDAEAERLRKQRRR